MQRLKRNTNTITNTFHFTANIGYFMSIPAFSKSICKTIKTTYHRPYAPCKQGTAVFGALSRLREPFQAAQAADLGSLRLLWLASGVG